MRGEDGVAGEERLVGEWKIMYVVDTPIVLMNMHSERLFWCFIWSSDYNHYVWILYVAFWGCNIPQPPNGWNFTVEDSSGHRSTFVGIGTSNQGPETGLILRWMNVLYV